MSVRKHAKVVDLDEYRRRKIVRREYQKLLAKGWVICDPKEGEK